MHIHMHISRGPVQLASALSASASSALVSAAKKAAHAAVPAAGHRIHEPVRDAPVYNWSGTAISRATPL
jgi:hypothetical protein